VQHLKEIFGKYGEIESATIKQKPEGTTQPNIAFVCFKTPDSAANAKAYEHGNIYEAKKLIVTHYEIPERLRW